VRRAHFNLLRPVCIACRAAGREALPLTLGTVARAEGDELIEAIMLCPEPRCRREHPIVDGIPIIVGDLAGWASHQLHAVLRRTDLSAAIESLLADAAGPGTELDRERSNLSNYGRSHWGDLDAEEPLAPGDGFAALLENALAILPDPAAVSGPWIDLGCATGRGTLELTRRTGGLAVGVDLSFAMLRVAERVRREGVAGYPQRRGGLVYDRRDFDVARAPTEDISLWCCDVAALPFADATFGGALSLNVLDCVASPLGHLTELGRVLAPGSSAALSTPYDWSAAATAAPSWIGGHSQRSESHGSSEAALRWLLAPGAPAGIDTGLVITAERERVGWRFPTYDRSRIEYDVHLVALARTGARGAPGAQPVAASAPT
jgi:SAM-dependent methyltransferase